MQNAHLIKKNKDRKLLTLKFLNDDSEARKYGLHFLFVKLAAGLHTAIPVSVQHIADCCITLYIQSVAGLPTSGVQA